jgi:hypothetical protein
MFFHTVTCTCGWNFGPAKKSRVKDMLAFHKEIHRLEQIVNNKEDDGI